MTTASPLTTINFCPLLQFSLDAASRTLALRLECVYQRMAEYSCGAPPGLEGPPLLQITETWPIVATAGYLALTRREGSVSVNLKI
jgi:hypothetical protein